MFKIPQRFAPTVGALVVWLGLPVMIHGQGLNPSAALVPAMPDVVVVEVEVDEWQLVAIGDQFHVRDIERMTRDRAVMQLVVDRARLRDLARLGVVPKIDPAATLELEEGRSRRQAASPSDSQGPLVGTLEASTSGITDFPCYRTVEETNASLSGLASTYPDLATWLDVGDSRVKAEGPGPGYDIGVLKVTDSNAAGPKAPFVIIAATHAREYATAETATRFGEYLVENFGTDPDVTAFLRHVEVWIMPVHNPDGRKIAEGEYNIPTGQRKNLRETCVPVPDGVDLNRNSEQFFRFSCDGVECPSSGGFSTFGCSELYTGPDWPNDGGEDPEPETIASNALMAMAFTDQRGTGLDDAAPDTAEGLFISIHTFGQLVLLPWEARWTDPPNFEGLRTLGRRFGHRLPFYVVCQDCFGTASGTNVDEAYGRYGVAAYTFELGDKFHQECEDEGGVDFENEVWPQALDALLLGLKSARRPYLEPGGPEVHSLSWTTISFLPGEQIAITGTADDTRVDWTDQGDSSLSDKAAQPEHDVTGVFYSIELPPWDPSAVLVPLAPADGTYDSSTEGFTGFIDTTGLGAGPHLVWIVAEDDEFVGGQMGVASAVLVEGDFLFADGFESGDTAAWSP